MTIVFVRALRRNTAICLGGPVVVHETTSMTGIVTVGAVVGARGVVTLAGISVKVDDPHDQTRLVVIAYIHHGVWGEDRFENRLISGGC